MILRFSLLNDMLRFLQNNTLALIVLHIFTAKEFSEESILPQTHEFVQMLRGGLKIVKTLQLIVHCASRRR